MSSVKETIIRAITPEEQAEILREVRTPEAACVKAKPEPRKFYVTWIDDDGEHREGRRFNTRKEAEAFARGVVHAASVSDVCVVTADRFF